MRVELANSSEKEKARSFRRVFPFPPLIHPLSKMSSLFATGGGKKSTVPNYTSSTPRHHASSSSSSRLNPVSSSSRPTTQQQQQVLSLSPDQQTEIREAFELFDLDKDQRLDYHEFKVSLRALGFDLKKSEVLKLMRERVNHDQNGGETGGGGQLVIGLEPFMTIGRTPLSLTSNSSG